MDPQIDRSVRNKSMPKAKSSKGSILGNLVLVAISILFSVVMIEVALSFFPEYQVKKREADYVFCGEAQSKYRMHPVYGYTEQPGISYFERSNEADPWIYVRINQDGFRDNWTHHGEDVLVLGDSFTRGSLVNEDEIYTSLLNEWRPDLSFRNLGMGGYGQANTLKIYEDVGKIPHRLVIQQITLINDLDDNAERAKIEDGELVINVNPQNDKKKKEGNIVQKTHNVLWNYTNLYPIMFNNFVKPNFGYWDARKNIDGAIDLTRMLLHELAEEAKANDADLLLLVLPSWEEMSGIDSGMEPQRQREMLKGLAAEMPNVFLLDLTPAVAVNDLDRVYGINDKHMTAFGHYLIARELNSWMSKEWPRGAGSLAQGDQDFVVREAVAANCDMADEYAARVQ